MSAEAPRGITITSSRSPELLLDAEAVVFDCDGLLVDSESVWLELIAEQHRRLGLSATPRHAWPPGAGRPNPSPHCATSWSRTTPPGWPPA